MHGLIAAAVHTGLTLKDFDDLTIGMLLDVLSEFISEKDRVYIAGQEDIDRYL